MSELQITKKSVDYNMRKSAKIGVFPALGHIWPLKWDVLGVNSNWINSKGITDVHEKFWQKLCQNSWSPKSPWTIAHENRQNEGFTWSGAYLILKMGWFRR